MKNASLGNLTLVFAISLVLVFAASRMCENYPALARWMGGSCWLSFDQNESLEGLPLASAPLIEMNGAPDMSDSQVMKAAIYSLGHQGSKEARHALMEIVRSDSDITLRKAAIHALQNMGSDEELVTFLAELAITDTNLELRKAAVHALGHIGTRAAQDALVEVLEKVATNASF